ncbi:MAG: tetratricopeptide repeat protein [candidate division Zixibacteria bacterium]|nr:tetratricopeptide repeat protein [candidate division Zixibacteria bacterium]
MYQKVRLTKRQIKEDKFTTFMLKSRSWLLGNWQLLVIGVAAAVLIIVASVYYAQSRATRAGEAATKYAHALQDYRNKNNQVAIMGFTQIVEDYSGDKTAEHATFLLGKLNYRIRNYDEAIRYFEMYLNKYRNNTLTRAAASAGVASCYEDQGNFVEAAEKFQQAFSEFPDGPLGGDYLNSAMRNYLEIGEIEKARADLDSIKARFEGSELVKRAVRRFVEKNPG